MSDQNKTKGSKKMIFNKIINLNSYIFLFILIFLLIFNFNNHKLKNLNYIYFCIDVY